MELNQVKRVAAEVMGVGETRVRIRDGVKSAQAMTRDDVRSLIAQNSIVILPLVGVSRSRARHIRGQKGKGLRKGQGSRHGSKKARGGLEWPQRVRALRDELAKLKLKKGARRKLYMMIKGGYFKSREHIKRYSQEKSLLISK
ncbi:50S ribosomal protein L19e [Candidatus Micrarchaeota archaeon]|nr:50S ribosomal protein L19e [Candidatus Micrarchaeota archaeon]